MTTYLSIQAISTARKICILRRRRPLAEMVLVRRKLVEQSLLLMMTRDLVAREATADGIKYGARERHHVSVVGVFQLPGSSRSVPLGLSKPSVVSRTNNSASMMRRFFDKWVEEFHHVEQSLGGEA